MPDRFGFLPTAGRSSRMDAARHTDLGASLAHIAEAAVAAAPEISKYLESIVANVADGQKMPPLAFGLYYELVDAIAGDDLVYAVDCAKRLSEIEPRAEGLGVHCRGSIDYAAMDQMLDLRIGEGASKFAPVDPTRAAEMSQRISDGLDLLRAGLPDLADELAGLVHEVCVAQAPEGSLMKFDGASHYQFWGLLLLNPNYHQDRLAMAEVLAHEAGHSLLFGLTVDEPLVLNPDEDLYPSPLRADLRPMDGIFHATFVSARMSYAMEGLADSGVLTTAEAGTAREAAAIDRANFASGYSVITDHARLTATGRQIITGARDWIESTRGDAPAP